MIGKGNDCLFPLYIPVDHKGFLRVRCGHCITCKMAKTREWCLRLQMESMYWKNIAFITLTYDDASLPRNIIDGHLFFSDEEISNNPDLGYLYYPTLRSDHLQLYLKRLRKRLDHKVKFFAVGEYGTKLGRPHIHLMVFGLEVNVYTRFLCKSLWKYGFVDVKHGFPESCAYIAGYVQKKLYGRNKDFFRLPEFMRCSQHLGERWIYDHLGQFDDDHAYIVLGEYKYAIPRTFRRLLVKLGYLTEVSESDLIDMQLGQLKDLQSSCDHKGITLSQFFDGRWKNAVAKERRHNSKRDTTGDI